MSFLPGSVDGVHIERLNAEQMRRRGFFINVAPAVRDEKTQSEHQTPSFISLRNNLNISPGGGREAFTKASSGKVSESEIRQGGGLMGDVTLEEL
jgi:hypothetical protein